MDCSERVHTPTHTETQYPSTHTHTHTHINTHTQSGNLANILGELIHLDSHPELPTVQDAGGQIVNKVVARKKLEHHGWGGSDIVAW